jgi:coenzyme Q-binding protein COQ10
VQARVLSLSVERDLPYSREQLFSLAGDIERYPEFLPWWQSARLVGPEAVERDSARRHVQNTVSIGPMRLQFGSEALLLRPERIEFSSTEAPFQRLHLVWLFASGRPAGCHLTVSAEVAMRSTLMQMAVSRSLNSFLSDIVSAFQSRAQSLYG